MGWTYDEEEWNERIAKFDRSMIPDHTKGLLKLIQMLKKEIDCAHDRFKDYRMETDE